jgi:predicted DNA-binding ribbon-helix-helix protein
VSSLAIAGAGVCSPADKRYLIRQTNATARWWSITIVIRLAHCVLWERLGERAVKSPIVKRSVVLAGHKTSVSLEDAFWRGLKDIAWSRRTTLANLINNIDLDRERGNLSSALRLFVLNHYQARAA